MTESKPTVSRTTASDPENKPAASRTTTSTSDTDNRLTALEARMEDVLDYLYGTNVRPSLTERTEESYAAEQRTDNIDDSARKDKE